MSKPRITRDGEILRLYADTDLTIPQIAKICGVGPATVSRRAFEAGLNRRQLRVDETKTRRKQARLLFDQGKSIPEIASELELSYQTTYLYLRREGIDRFRLNTVFLFQVLGEMCHESAPIEEIAEKFELEEPLVRGMFYRAKKMGIPVKQRRDQKPRIRISGTASRKAKEKPKKPTVKKKKSNQTKPKEWAKIEKAILEAISGKPKDKS